MIVMMIFIVSAFVGPMIVTFLAEHLPVITDFIASLSTPALYTGVGALIVILYAASWSVTTVIYQRKAF